MEEKLFYREGYLERIKPFIGKHIIKVLTGQRRVGKSYLMKLLIREIGKSENVNIIYIDKEQEQFSGINNHEQLYDYVKTQLQSDKNNYLFVDEVQEIDEFQKCLRSLLNEQLCDIYCTGSNAHILSGELATQLAGRYVAFTVHSLSYTEFLNFNNIADSDENLNRYLTIGGMPYQHHIGTEPAIVFEYLKNVYASILLKDVVSRENIRNVALLENLVAFLADNTGSLLSAQNISKYLKSQQIKMPTQTVINYLKALSNAYFIHRTQRADIQGLKIFEIGEKYYFEDLGIRNSVRAFNFRADIAKLIENAVYIQLLRLGYQVYTGKDGEREIDFIGEKDGERIYVQACYLLADEKTVEREFGNLMLIEDNYPKYVVTLDPFSPHTTYKGIRQLHLREFLKSKEF